MLRSRLVLATFVAVACAGCNANDSVPTSAATPTSTGEPTAQAPSDPATSVPPELAGYSDQERAAYQTAVAEYDTFVNRNDKFYAAGRTTVAAKNFYQHYAIDWSTAWGDLAEVANNEIKVTGSTKTVWTRPKSIKLDSPKGDVIDLRRCLDESGRIVTQNGRTVPQPQLRNPHVYTVRLNMRRGESWWRVGVVEQGRTC